MPFIQKILSTILLTGSVLVLLQWYMPFSYPSKIKIGLSRVQSNCPHQWFAALLRQVSVLPQLDYFALRFRQAQGLESHQTYLRV